MNEWEAPISGDYVIQLHAAGGKGGNTYAKYVSNGASYPMTQYTVTGATGGGGGGSGAKITLTLNKGTNHTLSVSNSKASFDNYYVNKGTDGKNGNINTVTGGKGGAYGTYANGMTLLAKAGKDGGASTKTSALFYNYYSEGGNGGDGSALKDANDTGAYGSGGSAGSFLGGSLPGGEEEAIIQGYATLNYTGNRVNDTLLIPFIFQNVKEKINNTYSFRILSPSNVDADYFSGIQLQITHSNNNIDQIYFDVSVVSEGDVTVDKIYLWIYN